MSLVRVLTLAACLLAQAARAQDVYTASGHPNWPPFSWQNLERMQGVGFELTTLVMKELGLKVRFVPMGNWKRVQAQAESGRLDLIVAIYQTEERKRYLAYTGAAFMDDANVIWVARERPFNFDKWDDLIGKRGTAMLGESYGEAFDRFIKERLQVEWVNTPAQNLGKLAMGRADYYPFSLYAGQIQLRQFGYVDKIIPLPQRISTEGVYLAVARKSNLAAHMAQIEAVLARLQADGTVERLVKQAVAEAGRIKPH